MLNEKNAKYFFFGFAPSGRAEFAIIAEDGTIYIAAYTIPEVYSKLINKGVNAVNLSKKKGNPPPEGFPNKRW
jgi:hypothetical protein